MNEELCFRIEVLDESQRGAKWAEWRQALVNHMEAAGITLNKPPRREGRRMTVAVLGGDYRQANDEGLLDFERTVQKLKQAEMLVDAALASISSSQSCEPDGAIPTELKVVWREWDDVQSGGFGHGVEFHDTAIENRDESLVGFLDGFNWLHGVSNEVVICCIKPNTRTPQNVLSSMKQRVEELLARRELPTQQITSRISALVNG